MFVDPKVLRGSGWPTDREVSLSRVFKLIACLWYGKLYPSVCTRVLISP